MNMFFKKLFSRFVGDRVEKISLPPGWNRTIADLTKELEEGRRNQVGYPELGWAREYERSLIPKHYRFPKKGDVYQARFDQDIDYMTSWAAPFTGGGATRIYKGEQIWIHNESEKKPIGTYALPVNYDELEERIVPASDRTHYKYGGFYFHINTVTLNENFDLVKTNFDNKPR